MIRTACVTLLLLTWSVQVQADWSSLWFTPDQQGQRLFERGDYAGAAKHFTTPERIGVSLYLAGDYEQAAAVLGRSSRPEASFNCGNSLVFLGQYDAAIEAYQLALRAKPDWLEAQQNLAIALARRAKLAPADDDAGGTGGKLAADEIVFESSDRMDNASSEETIEEDGAPMSEEAMRAMWLRRVETRPAEFLANRFAYQLATQQGELESE